MIVVYRSMCITGVSVEVITVVKGLQMVYLVLKLDYDTFFFFFLEKGNETHFECKFFLVFAFARHHTRDHFSRTNNSLRH